MPRDDAFRVQHIRDAARDALEFVEGRDQDDLLADRMLARALINCIEVIGEAASQLSAEFRMAHPSIDWSAIVGMRHRLIHAYYDINLTILWRTVTQDVPELLSRLDDENT